MQYTTVSGDTFDSISYEKYGSEKHATKIIEANLDFASVLIFTGGTELIIPEIETVQQFANLPPWKK